MTSYESSRTVLKLPMDLTLCGLGGCGKRMVGEICKHEWFLKYYSQGGRNLRIYTMDTDANEREQDELSSLAVLEEVENLGGQGSVKYTALFLPNLANISMVSHLASEEVVRKIKETKAEPKASVWWLNDPNNGLTFDDLWAIDPGIHEDFSGGVHRRRAISKAIFYKVICEGEAVGFPRFSRTGTNAIIVGLGGGTGSGMFIDLARYIRAQQGETAQILLFVILPTTNESEAEQANAAIALTELEYINQKERLFNNIVLTSLGPTGYKKGEEARQEVRDFDAAFPYIFTNFFQIEKGDLNISDARKSYSSFIHADAHIISYPVEKLRNLKKRYEEVINELSEVTESRKKLNQVIGDLREDLIEITDPIKEGTPTREDFDYIKKEYGNIEKVWSHDIGRLLGYQTNEGVEFFIANNIPEESRIEKIRSYDDLLGFIRSVENFAQQVKEDELKDDTDKKLLRVIPESLRTLETTALQIKKLAGVQEEAIRTALIECLKGREDLSQRVRDLESRKRAVREELHVLEAKLGDKESSVEKLEEQKKNIEVLVKEALSAVEQPLSEYIDLRSEIAVVKSHETNLKTELDRLFAEFRKREKNGASQRSWLDKVGVTAVQGHITSLKTDIKSLPLDDLSTLIEKIGLYYYYDMRIHQIDEAGLGSKFVGLVTGKPQKQRIRFLEAKQSEKVFAEKHAEQWHISFSPSSFEPSVPADFLSSSLEGRLKKLERSIIKDLFGDSVGSGISPSEVSAIFESNDLTKIRAALKQALLGQKLTEIKYDAQVADLMAEISNLKRQCDKSKAMLEVIGKVIDSIEGSLKHRRDINLHYDRYGENFAQIKNQKGFAWRTQRGLYSTTFGDINPKILSLIRDDSTLADLDNDEIGQSELDKLVNEVEATYKSLIDSHKLGVHSLMIPITTSESWCFGKVGLIVSSPSRKVSEKLMNKSSDEINRDINLTLALGNPNDSIMTAYDYARPWEIALTFFAAAGFLDNISPLIAGGGYWEVYKKRKNNILHHVLLMNEGRYIIRKKLLDLKEAGELAKRENGGSNVSKEVLSLYDVKQIEEALHEVAP